MNFMNKICNFFFFVIMVIFSSCSVIPKEDRIVDQLIGETLHEAKEKYGLVKSAQSQTNSSSDLRLCEKIELFFRVDRLIEKPEARIILFDMMDSLLRKFNSHEEIRAVFVDWPLTEENFSILVFVNPRIDEESGVQNIRIFEISRGKIIYSYRIPNQEYDFREEYDSPEEIRNVEVKNM